MRFPGVSPHTSPYYFQPFLLYRINITIIIWSPKNLTTYHFKEINEGNTHCQRRPWTQWWKWKWRKTGPRQSVGYRPSGLQRGSWYTRCPTGHLDEKVARYRENYQPYIEMMYKLEAVPIGNITLNLLVLLPAMSLKAEERRSREQMKKYRRVKTARILVVLRSTRFVLSLEDISKRR